MQSATFGALAVCTSLLLSAPLAHAQSAKDGLERFGLIGMFAPNCSQPISRSNGYIYYRALPNGQVQRDTMVSQTERMFVSVIEAVVQVSGNDVTVSGTTEGKRVSYTLRVEGQRHRVMQWTEDGVQSVKDGIWTQGNYTMPWVTKCAE